MTMKHALPCVLLAACASLAPAYEQPTNPIYEAVSAAWVAASGLPLPSECAHLDREYELVREPDVACEGEPLGGCIHPQERLLVLDEALSERDAQGMEVHLWLHALAECAYGDEDGAHLRAGVWLSANPRSAEALAWEELH
jgi:hypothetical protein